MSLHLCNKPRFPPPPPLPLAWVHISQVVKATAAVMERSCDAGVLDFLTLSSQIRV